MHDNKGKRARLARAVVAAALLFLPPAWIASHAAGSEPARITDPRLTATEMRWLQAFWPVLLFAREAGLPVDVVVQPQAAVDLPPLGLAWTGGRCKFVLSLRGNPEVPATDARIAPEIFEAAMQLMAAHELGHCTRHVRGEWMAAGDLLPVMASQREEAYADLVGLAWTQRHHPALFSQVHAWLLAERQLSRQRGPVHDTLAWAQLASRADRFGTRSVFAEADALWRQGLPELTAAPGAGPPGGL